MRIAVQITRKGSGAYRVTPTGKAYMSREQALKAAAALLFTARISVAETFDVATSTATITVTRG